MKYELNNTRDIDEFVDNNEDYIMVFYTDWCFSSRVIVDYCSTINDIKKIAFVNISIAKNFTEHYKVDTVPTTFIVESKKILKIIKGCDLVELRTCLSPHSL